MRLSGRSDSSRLGLNVAPRSRPGEDRSRSERAAGTTRTPCRLIGRSHPSDRSGWPVTHRNPYSASTGQHLGYGPRKLRLGVNGTLRLRRSLSWHGLTSLLQPCHLADDGQMVLRGRAGQRGAISARANPSPSPEHHLSLVSHTTLSLMFWPTRSSRFHLVSHTTVSCTCLAGMVTPPPCKTPPTPPLQNPFRGFDVSLA